MGNEFPYHNNMKAFNWLALIVAFVFLGGCAQTIEEDTSRLTRLTQHTWRIDQFLSPTNQPITDGQLTVQAIALRGLLFDFQMSGNVRGLDRLTRQVVNQGVWEFQNLEQSIDVRVTGFSGVFTIIELTNQKLVLETDTGNFVQTGDPRIRLEFIPQLQ